MSLAGFDPEILQDFLTESGELLDQLEGDLVSLESAPTDLELINQVFRALHTIKGSASFLALTNLVELAHAAESALNAARNELVTIDRAMMDLLLEAVDVLKVQFDELREGKESLTAADAELIQQLSALGEGKAVEQSAEASTPQSEPSAHDADGAQILPLDLDSGKSDLLDFFISDLESTLQKIEQQLEDLGHQTKATEGFAFLSECTYELLRSIDFFQFEEMRSLATLFAEAAENGPRLDAELLEQVQPRLAAIASLMLEQTEGLRKGHRIVRPVEGLIDRLHGILAGEMPTGEAALEKGSSGHDALKVDGVIQPKTPEPASTSGQVTDTPGPSAEPAKPTSGGEEDERRRSPSAAPEQTIRVEVGRLETLMNLVGELVLQKNRISALSEDVESGVPVSAELAEAFEVSSGNLARITSDIQVAVMRTRMQPLDKLFGKYPRLIRDLAKKTGKQIELEVIGGETEVDKSVIEELGDPLVHLLRNSADHGLESAEERIAAGKDPTGTITLQAQHQGGHVQIQIIDDGRGLNRERIAQKAVERGLVSESELPSLSDEEVFRFIMLPGFSTASQVSDLSGRGVGMDVVRTNIEKLKGSISVSSEAGRGTTITITIPLTVAIMPAMMVGISNEIYAIPLGSIVEIVRPEDAQYGSIVESKVVRLRESVLPVVEANEAFGVPEEKRLETPFAIVLEVNEKRIALMVSEVIGQQEIVVKPLDGLGRTGPLSGATVRNDGGVSLIVDVAELVRQVTPSRNGVPVGATGGNQA
ncbi:MAG: chemotaxis protein CheA [Planctomycetota bacterium]|nr:MAG: chemotaxis protein CheA [Planctomycetota bacterium]